MDKNTRYYLDIDLALNKAISWNSGDRFDLSNEQLPKNIVRIFITKGQFNKLIKKIVAERVRKNDR